MKYQINEIFWFLWRGRSAKSFTELLYHQSFHSLEKLENIFCTFDIPSDETRSVFPSKPMTYRHFKSTLENRNRTCRSTRSNRTQSRNDKENLEFLRAESRTGLEKLLTLSNSRIPRPTATATIRNRPEECMALQIWKPKWVPTQIRRGPFLRSVGLIWDTRTDDLKFW